MKKLFILFIAVAGFGVSGFAQSGALTSTETATANIITPLTLTSSTPMDFGNIAGTAAGGSVELTTADVANPTGVTIPAAGAGTPKAATFVLHGDGANTFSILLPAAPLTVRVGADVSKVMTISSWTSDPTPTGTLVAGVATVKIGATLTVGPNQAAGKYDSVGSFSVTFAYN